MSESDSFIDEVAEEVRRDRLFALLKKYGWIGIVAVVAIVGGAAWNEWQKARAQAQAEAFGDAVLAAVGSPEAKDRAVALAEVEADGSVGRATVAGFLTAADAAEAGDVDGALKALYAVAEIPDQSDLYRQLAMLKIITIAGDRIDKAERDDTLARLATPGAPFRALALEQQALNLLAEGNADGAVSLFEGLREDADATPALMARVEQVLTAIETKPTTE